MPNQEQRTELIKFRVTPSEQQLIERAVSVQQRRVLRDTSKCCRALLVRWAHAVMEEAEAEGQREAVSQSGTSPARAGDERASGEAEAARGAQARRGRESHPKTHRGSIRFHYRKGGQR